MNHIRMNDQINRLVSTAHTDVSEKWVNVDELEKYTVTVISECIAMIEEMVNRRMPASTYAPSIKERFGIV